MRQKKMVWRAAIAVLGVTAVLGASTGVAKAVFGFDVNKSFETAFGMNEKEDEKLHKEKVILSPNIADTHNGYTVEAEKVIATEHDCFVWLKITAPEETWPLEHPVCFGDVDMYEDADPAYQFYQNGKEIKSGIGISYAFNKPDSADGKINWEPERGITYQVMELDPAEGEETWDNSTLQIKMHGLNVNDKVIDKETVWNLEIPVELSDKTVTYEVQQNCKVSAREQKFIRYWLGDEKAIEEVSVTKVAVHPFEITLEMQRPAAWDGSEDYTGIGNITGYECKDGSVVKFEIEKGRSNSMHRKDDNTYEMYERYYEPIDVDNIAAVYLNGERIPLE